MPALVLTISKQNKDKQLNGQYLRFEGLINPGMTQWTAKLFYMANGKPDSYVKVFRCDKLRGGVDVQEFYRNKNNSTLYDVFTQYFSDIDTMNDESSNLTCKYSPAEQIHKSKIVCSQQLKRQFCIQKNEDGSINYYSQKLNVVKSDWENAISFNSEA